MEYGSARSKVVFTKNKVKISMHNDGHGHHHDAGPLAGPLLHHHVALQAQLANINQYTLRMIDNEFHSLLR